MRLVCSAMLFHIRCGFFVLIKVRSNFREPHWIHHTDVPHILLGGLHEIMVNDLDERRQADANEMHAHVMSESAWSYS